jgi:ubiquinone/menaquinone biosynthesis C-methylase UbiE
LDIACGEGYGSDILKKAGASEVYGADLDNKIIADARVKYPDINFIVSEATRTPFEKDFFDIIISFETWHHLDKFEDFVPEMARILKPSGLLILSVPNEKIIYLNPFHKNFLTEFYRFDFSKDKIKKYLKNYFVIKNWYGQRFVKRIYANPLARFLFFVGGLVSGEINRRASIIYKLADGSTVKPLLHNNARYLIAVCQKKDLK